MIIQTLLKTTKEKILRRFENDTNADEKDDVLVLDGNEEASNPTSRIFSQSLSVFLTISLSLAFFWISIQV